MIKFCYYKWISRLSRMDLNSKSLMIKLMINFFGQEVSKFNMRYNTLCALIDENECIFKSEKSFPVLHVLEWKRHSDESEVIRCEIESMVRTLEHLNDLILEMQICELHHNLIKTE